ncbi:hypothetical protein [Paenibacillus sp. Marseille-Q4541]|uniref:hypothetical protein n=1 Tax=Paenibacillus sp. Marseille-Q4541 TaxID=2831522 RepID=UPI001BA7507D|nr:hypothetical protein [Paenibacillus sp. Marseille-Q4541]
MAIRKDKMQSVYAGNITSLLLSADAHNGQVFVVGDPVAGEREVFKGVAPTDVLTQEIVVLTSPEVLYERKQHITDFVNIANKVARADHYTVADIITVTDDVIEGTSVVGQYLIPANGKTKLVPAANLTGGTRFAAQVIEKTKIYGKAATAYRVVKA